MQTIPNLVVRVCLYCFLVLRLFLLVVVVPVVLLNGQGGPRPPAPWAVVSFHSHCFSPASLCADNQNTHYPYLMLPSLSTLTHPLILRPPLVHSFFFSRPSPPLSILPSPLVPLPVNLPALVFWFFLCFEESIWLFCYVDSTTVLFFSLSPWGMSE